MSLNRIAAHHLPVTALGSVVIGLYPLLARHIETPHDAASPNQFEEQMPSEPSP